VVTGRTTLVRFFYAFCVNKVLTPKGSYGLMTMVIANHTKVQ
jgi:hypothetical protein